MAQAIEMLAQLNQVPIFHNRTSLYQQDHKNIATEALQRGNMGKPAPPYLQARSRTWGTGCGTSLWITGTRAGGLAQRTGRPIFPAHPR